MRCVICHRKGRPITLPLVGRVMILCARCTPGAMIREMRRLVAHG